MYSRFFFLFFVMVILLQSCQDKYLMAYTPPAAGTLKKDASSNCLPQTVAGTYTAGKALNDSCFLQVTVNVTRTGTYTIHTGTVNGFSFSGSGSFTAAGQNQVKLKATGTPLAAGTSNFSVQFDTSVCTIAVTVVPAGGTTATAAVYTFNGAPGACANDTLAGSFVKSVILDTFFKVGVQVQVVTPGTYTIATGTVNGYSFAAKGSFTTAGTQLVYLYGTGTPLATGTDLFTVNGSSSSCGFSVQVLSAVPVSNNDHFPLTAGSYWTYDDLFNRGDTLARTINDSVNINGVLYKQMQEQPQYGAPVSYQYRRDDSVYYEHISVDKYTTSMKFSPAIIKDFPFLREYLNTGDTWTSEEYVGTATFGQQIFLRYDFTCTNSNATVTLNGKTFTGVYKIVMRPKIRSALTYPYNSTSEIVDLWYAKGIGLIYTKKINNSFIIYENQLRNWLVK